KEEKEILKIEELKDKIEGKQIKIKVKVGPRNIFGSVTKKEIVEALKKEEISIEKQNIELEKPIKKLGEFSVPIKLSPNQKAYAKIKVEGKNG
ncbi:MAG: 50S ribosomal protein L9, partial [Candidatus Aenigmarchaeota archaeon]|nr:50S ribosomal protein L9 [Candidatus Aenigmarchaeota archaeon]